MNRFLYIPGFLLLSFLYHFTFDIDGYMLPYYFFPNGTVLESSPEDSAEKVSYVNEIGGRSPLFAKNLYDSSALQTAVTDLGTGMVKPVAVNEVKIFIDFKFLIFISYVFLICGIWFLHYGNDIHLSVLSFSVTAFVFISIYMLVFHRNEHYWLIAFMLLSPVLLNMGLRISGKNISGYLLLGELIGGIFFSLIIYTGKDNMFTVYAVIELAKYLFAATAAAVFILILSEAFSNQKDPIEKRKRWVLAAGTFIGLVFPLLLLQSGLMPDVAGGPLVYPFILGLAFPASLLYGTYRIYLIPFQLVLTRSILAALLTVALISIYAAVLLAHSVLLPEQERTEQWIVNLIFVLILVFFLDPARKWMLHVLENRLFRLSPLHTKSLEKIASALSSPVRGNASVNLFLKEIENTLAINHSIILLSDGTFEGLQMEDGRMIRISDRSLFWRHLLPDKIVVASYLTYAGGSRASLYRFLIQNDVYVGIGVMGDTGKRNLFLTEEHIPLHDKSIKAALLLGPRKDGRKYTFTEIRYLQEATRLGAMMINDYSLLINEIEKRRRVRELSAAAEVQRSLINPENEGFENIHVSYFDLPAISVTGDYLDLVALSEDEIACFLGDVSGHGLGTGYLVSAIRSIVHSHMESGASLTETFNLLNDFLHKRYGGHEYLTMIGMVLNTKTGEMEYINSAHPAPVIYTPGIPDLLRLSNTQRMLGILDRPYTSSTIHLMENQKLFLFSDGVTETFSPGEKLFGDGGIIDFVNQHAHENPDYITIKLKDVLNEFRGTTSPSDDTTFLVLEFRAKSGDEAGGTPGASLDEMDKTQV